MEGFKKLARTAALNSLPYQNTATHTHRGSTQQTTCPSLTSLPLHPFLRASPLPCTAHTRLKCGIVVCLVLLLCAVQKNFFNKNIKFAYVAPRRWQRSKLSWQLSPSLSLSAGQTFWGCLWLPVAGTAFAAGSGNQAAAAEVACGAKAALSGPVGG